jgi:hypothetical protein
MMEFAAAFAASHAGLIVTRRDLGPSDQVQRIYDGFGRIKDEIDSQEPDAIVIIATDHQRVFPLEGVPQFSIGVGPIARGMGDAGVDPCEVPLQQMYAQSILEGLIERHVDIAFSEDVGIDHSFVVPLMLITPELNVPIVPITQNCNVPPRPRLQRSYDVGAALGDAIRSGPSGRVVIIGTGGLSHWVGSEERQEYIRRPAGTRIAVRDDYPVELEETGDINVDWDRSFLEFLGKGSAQEFIDQYTDDKLESLAGNGAHEVRNWLIVAGAVQNSPGEVMAYEPIAEWMTGTGIMRFAA